MTHRVTVIRMQRDGDFLAAQRRDPVTGRLFVAGDRVTVCAACLLVFLESSWHGIGGTHCGQVTSRGLEILKASPVAPIPMTNGDTPEVGNTLDTDGEPDSNRSPENNCLMPIPIALSQVPIKLR
jgi:hypothetical protein